MFYIYNREHQNTFEKNGMFCLKKMLYIIINTIKFHSIAHGWCNSGLLVLKNYNANFAVNYKEHLHGKSTQKASKRFYTCPTFNWILFFKLAIQKCCEILLIGNKKKKIDTLFFVFFVRCIFSFTFWTKK